MRIWKNYKGNLFHGNSKNDFSMEITVVKRSEIFAQRYKNDLMVYILQKGAIIVKTIEDGQCKSKLLQEGKEEYAVVDAGVKHSIEVGAGTKFTAYKLFKSNIEQSENLSA